MAEIPRQQVLYSICGSYGNMQRVTWFSCGNSMAGYQGNRQIIGLWRHVQDYNSTHKFETRVGSNGISRTALIENYLRNEQIIFVSIAPPCK